MKLFEEYPEWISEQEHVNVLSEVIYFPRWRFGQTSDDTIEPNYPCWFQSFYNHKTWNFTKECPDIIRKLSARFLSQIPDDFMLVRSMSSANTFGIDGDFHTDWPNPGVSITGVLYTDKTWETNWGGSTLFKSETDYCASEYIPRKLITFDSSISHIGCGPQRRCKEMRSILAFQAVQTDALKERVGDGVKTSANNTKVVQRYSSNDDPNVDIVA